MLGAALGVLYRSRRSERSLGELADMLAVAAPLGLAMGRLANFLGQELWGRPADLPWAVIFSRDPQALPRHPSQLYELILEGMLLFLVLQWWVRRAPARWTTSGLFLLAYGTMRFIVEFVREPDAHLGFVAWGWLTQGQLLSFPMVVVGIMVLVWAGGGRRSGA